MGKIHVLFISTYNGARSQMAEAYLNHIASDRFFAESAGLEYGELNPDAIHVMKEEGIDIAGQKVKNVDDFYSQRKIFDYVIITSERETIKECPYFPGVIQQIKWDISNPARPAGTRELQISRFRQARNEIKSKIIEFTSSI